MKAIFGACFVAPARYVGKGITQHFAEDLFELSNGDILCTDCLESVEGIRKL